MASVLISSSEEYSGKSALCIGIGTILKDMGYSVGYMKPIGNLLTDINGILTDEDAEEMRKTLESVLAAVKYLSTPRVAV